MSELDNAPATENTEVENDALETEESESNNAGFPEVYSKADAVADQAAFASSVESAMEGIPEKRQFSTIADFAEVPDDFNIVIDQRDSGSFKGKPASFIYAIPSYESLVAMGDAGQAIIRDAVESLFSRKAGAYCSAVNRRNGEFSMPKALQAWLETAKPASSGKRMPSKAGWVAVNEAIVAAINLQYKTAESQLRMSKRDLTSCMASAAYATATHPGLKAFDNIFAVAEKLIRDAVASGEHVKEDGTPKLDLERDLKILTHWKETRETKADMPDIEITDLAI